MQRAGGDVLSRLTARSARFFAGAMRAHKKALQAFALCMVSPALWAATPAGTTLTNVAAANYKIAGSAFSSTATSVVITDATIRFMAAKSGGTPTPVGASQCWSAGQLDASTHLPVTTANTVVAPDLNGGVAAGTPSLAPAWNYGREQTVYVEVADSFANKDSVLAETVEVTINSNSPADAEVVRLTETGPDTGVFVGAIQSTSAAPVTHNCAVSTTIDTKLTAKYSYVHSGSTITTAAAAAMVDPFGTVFDAVNGLPEDGAIVTLIDVATGLPAAVLCDDGIQASPNPIVSGSTFTACGGTVSMTAGGYRFPLINPGKYKLQVQPPAGYTFPSTNPAPNTTLIVGGVMGVPVSGYSYGGTFTMLPGDPALNINIPVDPDGKNLRIAKAAGRAVVGEGEYVPYTLTIDNESATTAAVGVQIIDRLPQGFRYQSGSSRLGAAVLADPVISADGRSLTFSLGTIAASGSVSLKYVTMVAAGAQTGNAENIAQSFGNLTSPAGLTSNIARASVMVREDLMRSRAILMGRVIIGSCDGKADNDKDGLQNARIVLEDGTYILTDQEGRWHAENIRPGTHVVQLDLDSLTEDYEVVTCEKNSRFAGRNYSQFVNVQGGSLWRADFHVQKKAVKEVRLTQHISAQRAGELIHVKVQLRGESEVRRVSSTLMLPDGVQFVAGSAQVDGKPSEALESSDGILTARFDAQQGAWEHVLTLDLQAAGQDPRKLLAMARFNAPSASLGINLPRAEITVSEQPAEAESFALIPQPVPHHESPNVPGAQDRGERTVRLDGDATPQPINADNRNMLVEQLPYDAGWLAKAEAGTEWLHPQESFLPSIPTIKVALKLVPGQQATLMLNGEPVSPLYYDGAETNATRTVALAMWRGIHIKDGDNKLEMIVKDKEGKEVLRQSRNIRYTDMPDRVELVPEHSRLVADGKTRPILALRFYDKDGYKMRRGINGEFQINSPYQSMNQLEADQRDPLGGKIDGKPRYEIGSDGIALVELAPTTQSGEAILNFTFGTDHTQELRTWLEVGQRDWVLVGIGEGTLAHKQLSGNVTALKEAGADSQLFDGDRLAFYAKGTVKGEYLLTMAYDTAKQQGVNSAGMASLQQTINPNQYYTLYADAAQPYFDGASARKLYLKIERKQFYALFGDYDTGLTVTEFSRYSRTVNGVKSEYKGDKFGYNAFATSTTQAYIKDEIPGDGTSGLYKFTRRNIVANTDKIRIETRDRFQSQIIVSSQSMSRYLDYDIDYTNGTVFFKQPIYARDSSFNPVYIVAEYESGDPLDNKLTAGGRVSFKTTDKVETGVTLVSDGTVGASGNLGGVDTTWQVNDKVKVVAEAATSQHDFSGTTTNGSAWKAELNRHEDGLDTKVYLREQQGGFGLGQQSLSENGTRKIGGDARLKMSETAQAQVQAYRQETLGVNATQRDVIDGRVTHNVESLTAYYGARYAGETSNLGLNSTTKQAQGGVGYTFAQKFTLRGDVETGLGKSSNNDFLDTVNLGADYKLTDQTKLFVEQQYARGEKLSTDMTRVGLSTQPWTGAAMAASLGNQNSLDSGRMYANMGMTQRWQVNEFWQADAGMDRSQTVRSSSSASNPNVQLNNNVAPVYTSLSGDYTAASLGANYNDTVWGANTHFERRVSSTNNKINLLFGVQRNLDAGHVLASGFSYIDDRSSVSLARSLDVRVSYASRPWDSNWVWLDRFDFVDERSNSLGSSTQLRKLVNNYNANWMMGNRTQTALQYGSKYVLDNIDGVDYSGYTDLIGAEVRRDIEEDWDVGAHISMLHSWSAAAMSYGLGASLGYKLVENAWLVVGYNFLGFSDGDFSGAGYRAQGPYITLRMKIDQDTLKLNDKNGGLFARTIRNAPCKNSFSLFSC